MSNAQEEGSKDSRKLILHQFTEETTFHGVRYMTEKAPLLRRLLWIILVVACVTGFLAVILTRLLYLLKFPKAVDLNVVYAKELHLPTITICNQNFFRKTKTFEMGYFDKVQDHFHRKRKRIPNNDKGICEDRFERETEKLYVASFQTGKSSILDAIETDSFTLEKYVQVSIKVCQELCRQQHGHLCNSFFYYHPDKTCLISKFTPLDEKVNQQEFITPGSTDTFTRRRCNGESLTVCSFDDANCQFYGEENSQDTWELNSASTGQWGMGPRSDHTTGAGQYMSLAPSRHGSKRFSSLFTTFLEATEPMCLEFARSMVGDDSDVGSLDVYKQFSIGHKKILARETPTRDDWTLEFVYVGTGVFRIEFVAVTSKSNIAIDDLTYGPCSQFVTDCRRDRVGRGYIGNISVSASGRSCIPWVGKNFVMLYDDLDFPEGSAKAAKNYCRNPDGDSEGPWCLTDGSTMEYCNISYCECTRDQFQCDNGMCINLLSVCDGRSDCPDDADETRGCDMSVDCTFEWVSKCGYRNVSKKSAVDATTWIRYAGRMRNGHLLESDDWYTGHYLYLDSGSVTLSYRQRVSFISPIITPSSENASGHCLTIHTYTGRDAIFPEAMGSIRIYQQFNRYEKKPVMMISGTEDHHWLKTLVALPPANRDTRVLIEGLFGRSYYSDMAVDEISLVDGTCHIPRPVSSRQEIPHERCFVISYDPDSHLCLDEDGAGINCNGFTCRNGSCIAKSRTCDGKVDCVDFADEDWDVCQTDISLSCDFADRYVCGYRDESDPDDNGWIWFPAGKSMVVKDDLMGIKSVKRLVSAKFNLSEEKCLSLNLTVQATSAFCSLSIHQEAGDQRELLYVAGYNEHLRGTWWPAYITIPTNEWMGLSFEVVCSSKAKSVEVGIRGLDISNGSCRAKFVDYEVNCVSTSSSNCGYLDDSREGANWVIMPDGRGLTASYWDNNGLPFVAAVLIGPEINLNEPRCLTLEFQSPDSGRTLPTINIVDVLNHDELLYEGVAYLGVTFGLYSDKHRLKITAFLSFQQEVTLSRVYVEDNLECLGTGVGPQPDCDFICDDGTCIPHWAVCNGVDDCPEGSDEGLCGYAPRDLDEMTTIIPPAERPTPPHRITENMTEFYYRAGHQSEDLLYGCTWAGTDCLPVNFSTEITDYGLCHTLNAPQSGGSRLKTANTGASSGLQLILNVEQYEYMHGPQPDAGVKMFLYDQAEVPFVRDLGFAVAPGLHALVAVKLSQTKSLSPPWGTCEQGSLLYGGNYSYSACIREKETIAMVKNCGCRDAYMPGYDADNPPICNMTTYLACVAEQQGYTTPSADACEEPCVRRIYEAQLSYASLSGLSVSQILSSNTTGLQGKLLKALRVKQRSNPQEFVLDISQTIQILTSYMDFLRIVRTDGWSKDSSVFVNTEQALRYFVLDLVKIDLDEVFLNTASRRFQMFENTYGFIRRTIKYHEEELFVQLEVLSRLLDNYISNSSDVETVVSQAKAAGVVLQKLKRAIQTYYKSLTGGGTTYTSSSLGVSLGAVEYLPEKPIKQNEKLCGEEEFSQKLSSGFSRIANLLHRVLNTTVERNISAEQVVLQNLVAVFSFLESFMGDVNVCIDEYYQYLNDVKAWKNSVDVLLDDLASGFTLGHEGKTVDTLLDFADEIALLNSFTDRVEAMKASLMATEQPVIDTMELFSDKSISQALQSLNKFVSRVQLRMIEPLRNKISNLKKQITNTYIELLKKDYTFSSYMGARHNSSKLHDMLLWRRPQADITEPQNPGFSIDVFKFQTSDVFVELQAPKVVSELVAWYTWPLEEALSKFDTTIRTHQTRITGILEKVRDRYILLRQERVIAEDFVRKNFLVLDIFFAQLKYQEIDQIKAYDVGSFFSDVGGFMGLLLGGSLITLFEFFDLIFYKLLSCPGCRMKKKKQDYNCTYTGKDEGIRV